MEIFCNIMNDFTVTFDQFNEYLLNKSINFIKIKKTPKFALKCLMALSH